jgi:hypothetical protein
VNLNDGIKLACIAKSGFHGGQALLVEDTNDVDLLSEDWANPELISAGSGALFNGGYFRLNINPAIK